MFEVPTIFGPPRISPPIPPTSLSSPFRVPEFTDSARKGGARKKWWASLHFYISWCLKPFRRLCWVALGRKTSERKWTLGRYHSDRDERSIKRIERWLCTPRPGSEPQDQAKGALDSPKKWGPLDSTMQCPGVHARTGHRTTKPKRPCTQEWGNLRGDLWGPETDNHTERPGSLLQGPDCTADPNNSATI